MNDNYNYRDYRTSSELGCGNFKNAARTPSSRNFSAFSWFGAMLLVLMLFVSQVNLAQTVTIGSGTNLGNKLPVVPYFGFSYSQQLVLKSEISTTGNIAKLRFYSNGTTLLNSNNWTIYLGHTSKSTFSSTTDWILSGAMTQVYSGTVTAPASAGWMEITLTTPFTYNNVENLVVSVDENATGDAGSSTANYFRIFTPTSNNRGIYYQSDSVNPDPASVTQTGTRVNYLNQMQLVFEALSTTAPDCAISHVPAASATGVVRNPTLSWANGGGGPTSYDVYFGTSASPALIGNQAGTTYTPAALASNTTYYWKIVPKNAFGPAVGCVVRSFTTGTGFNYCSVSTTNSGDYSSAFSTTLATTNISYTATSNPAGSYTDQTAQSFQVGQGTSFNFSHTYVGGANGVKAWIDYNNDGTFGTSEDVYFLANSNATKTGTITVPVGTPLGTYRMRIRSDYGSSAEPTACGSLSYGTTMDYALTVIAPPSCLAPPNLASSAVTATTASLSWTASASTPSNGYDVYYSTSATAPTASTTPTVNNHPPSSLNLTGLTSVSTYYWWVRGDCNPDTSIWVAGGSFTTTQILATLPYTQDFSGANSFSFVNDTQTNKWVNGSAAGNPGNSIYISNDAGVTNAYTVGSASVSHAYRGFAIPSGTTLANFSFDWKANGESTYDYLRVWLVPTSFTPAAGTQITAGAGRIQVGGNFNQQATWQTYTNASLDLSTFANSAMRLVFEWRNDTSGGTQTPAAVDNISLSIPTCIAPTALVSSAVTATTATLSWTASSSNPTNGYDIYYSTTNTAPLAGTTPTVDNNASATYNAAGLSASSTYYWWVRSDCGSETTLWISGGSFTTPCAPEATPTVVQNFDTFTSTTPPTCWSEATGALTASSTLTGTTSSWLLKTNGFANASSTNNGASINLYGTNNNWLISQQIDLGPTAGVKRLNFDYAVTSYNGTIAQTTLGTHQVRVVVSTDGGATWSLANVIKTYTGVASYSNTGASEQIILNYSGVVKIGFLATTSSTTPDIDFHIDNVGVDTAPTDTPDYVNLQFPASATILAGGSATVYARVFEGGLTDATSGQAPGIVAWIGISPAGADASSNPNTWTNWIPATFNTETDGGSNDEYQANIGVGLAVGTYRYASRFQLNGGPFVYGGNPFNAWNGTTSNSGELTVNANPTQCATLVAPANATTNVTRGTVALSWTAPASGPAPTGYKVYFGTTAGTTTLATTTGAGILTYNASAPAYGTTYYWRVVPTSVIGGGDAVGCAEFSFTTELDPFAPYCGALNFTSGVEPITLVNFAGINNSTSAVVDGTPDHENFISIFGDVTTENSYTMTVKGNTDGSFTSNIRIFIDWNQDGDFADAGETYNGGTIANSTGIDAVSAISTIAVPANALPGLTRMRVKKLFSNSNLENPCIAGGYGQVEEYTLNVTVCTPIAYYADIDGDGYGDPDDVIFSCSPIAGRVLNNLDCNPTAITYVDSDSDGFGSLVTGPCGALNNTDCDDTDPNKRGLFSFYADVDKDGFGAGALLENICAFDADTAPLGYSVNNTDCNDGNANIAPNKPEILYNGIDDNCNGLLDEGFQKVTKIQPSQCGATVATVYTSVAATQITGATGYTFHVRKLPVNPAFTPITDPAAQHVVTTNQYFAMRDVPGVEYGTDYEVSVEVRMSGNSVFVGYVGEPCRIGTPPVLAPNVAGGSTQCGTTLPNFYSTVGTTPVASAVAYKFFIKDIAPAGTGGLPVNYVGESIERSTAWFTLSMFQNVGYGRTYELQVAVKTSANGAFSPYSPVCVITTPPAQPLVNCEASIPAKYTNIATTNLSRVTQYEFELTNIGSAEPDPITTSTILTSKNYFNFNQLPAANYYAGIEYGVRVRVYVNNIVSEWTDPCVIISPAAVGRQSQDNVLAGQGFNAIALPNPFANSFAISVSTSSIEAVSYKVYDMTGRLLEARTAAVSDMASQEIGDRYPAGVYNVIVSQGTEIKTLRVIKR